jgi:hypothetical protein
MGRMTDEIHRPLWRHKKDEGHHVVSLHQARRSQITVTSIITHPSVDDTLSKDTTLSTHSNHGSTDISFLSFLSHPFAMENVEF